MDVKICVKPGHRELFCYGHLMGYAQGGRDLAICVLRRTTELYWLLEEESTVWLSGIVSGATWQTMPLYMAE